MFALLAALMLLFPGPSPLPRTHTLTGTVTIVQNVIDPVPVGSQCQAMIDYTFIHIGTPLVLRDHAQRIVAIAKLHTGIVVDHARPRAVVGVDCQFSFQIKALPYRDFYTIALSDRGQVIITQTDLDTQHWHITLNPYGMLM